MNSRVNELLEQAKLLSDEERTELGHEILASVPAEQENFEKAWAGELARRVSEVREGRVQTVDSDDLMAELLATSAP